MKDTKRNNTFFFRFVHLKSSSIIWEQEVYKDFQYLQERPFFHTFATDNCMVGLSFADDHEALAFYSKVVSRENLQVQRKQKASAATAPAKPSVTAAPVSSASLAGGTLGRTSISDKSKKPKFDKTQIGAPTNFRHLTHVGYDPEKGFSTMNIPPEWKNIFKDAGVTEKQLEDKETAKFIYEFMTKNQSTQNEQPRPAPAVPAQAPSLPDRSEPTNTPSRKAPPPPPSRTAPGPQPKGPPPPPPSRARPSESVPNVPPGPALPSRAPAPVNTKAQPKVPSGPTSPVSISPVSPISSKSGPGNVPMPPPPPPPPPVFDPNAAAPALPVVKKPSQPKAAPVPDTRNDLLASIRQAGVSSLKPASEREIPETAKVEAEPANDIAGALRAALMSRQQAIGKAADEDEEEEEEDDDW
jgi:Wiskott-Aldrich syndrome protein